ncbi:hypothetical protein AX14_006508 [Amanita brunnescens Koide BX004]|nr:hypothetical protein AX14_006508 [Amanita brunnescens Koide BX004]
MLVLHNNNHNDLDILENLKELIKSGQHEFYRAEPQPAALASVYLADDRHTRPSLQDRISQRQPSLEERLSSAPADSDPVDDYRPPPRAPPTPPPAAAVAQAPPTPSRTSTMRDKPPYYHDEHRMDVDARPRRFPSPPLQRSTYPPSPPPPPPAPPRDYEDRNEKARYPPAVAPPPPPSAPSRDRDRDRDWHYQQPPSGPGSYRRDSRDRERDWPAPPAPIPTPSLTPTLAPPVTEEPEYWKLPSRPSYSYDVRDRDRDRDRDRERDVIPPSPLLKERDDRGRYERDPRDYPRDPRDLRDRDRDRDRSSLPPAVISSQPYHPPAGAWETREERERRDRMELNLTYC